MAHVLFGGDAGVTEHTPTGTGTGTGNGTGTGTGSGTGAGSTAWGMNTCSIRAGSTNASTTCRSHSMAHENTTTPERTFDTWL